MTILPFRDPAAPVPFHVRGPLDSFAVGALAERIAACPQAHAFRLELGGVSQVDPVGVARLWSLAQGLHRAGRPLRLEGLPARFQRRLRLHPIMAYVDAEEGVFADPFAVEVSGR
jgi:ABC-type transporter Mla MlaB component